MKYQVSRNGGLYPMAIEAENEAGAKLLYEVTCGLVAGLNALEVMEATEESTDSPFGFARGDRVEAYEKPVEEARGPVMIDAGVSVVESAVAGDDRPASHAEEVVVREEVMVVEV